MAGASSPSRSWTAEAPAVSIEWFRDLSIAILGLVTTAFLIFGAVVVYRLYRVAKSTLLAVKAAAEIVGDAVNLVQEGVKSLVTILALVQGIRQGFERFSKKSTRENNEGE